MENHIDSSITGVFSFLNDSDQLKFYLSYRHSQYYWEQAEFDIIQRKTRISLHFHLQKQQRKLRHAFSYSWRL